jgi:predicted Zn-dependent peptidase
MSSNTSLWFSGAFVALALASYGTPASALDVTYTKSKLANGLTVILHENHALPIVAVNLAYRVGSRFEEKGRTGFAHLFEHLMFMGTERAPTKMFDQWMEDEGAWNNAWTSEDLTDYFDVGPTHALPLLLWLEADRLSSLGRNITQAKLDAQREVVRNERRQTSENTPYGKVELRLPELLFPQGNPYHHPVIGSHEDLQAASVEDVRQFFSHWYAPNNASLVVAGDFEPAALMSRIEQDFGWIPKGEVPTAPPVPPVLLTTVVRETIPDDVALPKIVMAWHSPSHFANGDAELDLLASVLEHGKVSRLYTSLVYNKKLAQDVTASQNSHDLGSYFTIEAIARPGVDLKALEQGMDAEIARVTSEAVTPEELLRAKNQFETGFVSRLQSVQARASMLNLYEVWTGDPGYADKDLERYRSATAAGILATAKTYLKPNARVILTVVPRAPSGGAGEGK